MATTQHTELSPASPQGFSVPVEIKSATTVPVQYANYVAVQVTEHDCYLVFCVVVPPVFTGTQEENQREAAKLKSIDANVVARVMVPRDLVPKLINTFQSVGLDKPGALQAILSNADIAKTLGGQSELVAK
jgi:hypothetical protein